MGIPTPRHLAQTLGLIGPPAATVDRPRLLVVAAAAPFAATSFARARLLRQLHAGGLLASGHRTERTGPSTGVAG